jgi:hypothetical protein
MYEFLSDGITDSLLRIKAGQPCRTIPREVREALVLCGADGEWVSAFLYFHDYVTRDIERVVIGIAAEVVVSKHPGGCFTTEDRYANFN